MFNYRRVELNKKEVNTLRLTMTDCEIMEKYKTSRENIITQCGKRKEEGLPFVQNNRPKHRPKKQANPGPRMTNLMNKQVPKKELVTESWSVVDKDKEYKPYYDTDNIVQIGMSPFKAFYDKINLQK